VDAKSVILSMQMGERCNLFYYDFGWPRTPTAAEGQQGELSNISPFLLLASFSHSLTQ